MRRVILALLVVSGCSAAPCPRPIAPTSLEEWWHLPGAIRFDDAGIDPRSRAFLEEAVLLAQSRSDVRRLRVEGHSDERASAGENQRISEERARLVADILAGMGVPRATIEIVGYGSSRRIAVSAALNRRVELSLLLARANASVANAFVLCSNASWPRPIARSGTNAMRPSARRASRLRGSTRSRTSSRAKAARSTSPPAAVAWRCGLRGED